MIKKPPYEELEKKIEALEAEIAAQKSARAELEARKDLFETVVNSLAAGVYVVDMRSHKILFANKFMKDLFKSELVGETCWKVLQRGQEGPCAFCTNDKLIDAEGRPSGFHDWEFQNTVTGTWCAIRDRAIPWLDNSLVKLEIAMDISQHMEAKQALKKSEKRFRELADLLPVIVCEVDRDFRITYANRLGLETFGYTGDDKGISALQLIHPDDRERAAKRLLEKVKGLPREVSNEYKLVRKDGSELFGILNGSLVYEEGELVGARFAITDISKRRELQSALQRSQKMDAIATLAGGIAHEFNNALSTVTGSVGMLEADYADHGEMGTYLGYLKSSSRRMAKLTGKLLAYAEGGMYQPKPVFLGRFIQQTIPVIAHSLGSRVKLEMELTGDTSPVMADSTQLEMLLSAVLLNGSEAMEGEGAIHITTGEKDVNAEFAEGYSGLKPGHYVCLAVKDHGKGMDEETRTRLFEPFFTTKFQGRGMGMAAAYGIVKHHGGYIYVDSEPEKGTLVRMCFPALETGDRKAEESHSKQKPPSRTVLVVEPVEMLRNIIRAMLEKLGYKVLEAGNADGAVDIARTLDGEIDLVLLDTGGSGMEDRMTFSRIKTLRPGLKGILVSAYPTEDQVKEAMANGFDAVLPKPFYLADVEQKLKKALGK